MSQTDTMSVNEMQPKCHTSRPLFTFSRCKVREYFNSLFFKETVPMHDFQDYMITHIVRAI